MANDQGTETPISPDDIFVRQMNAGDVVKGVRQKDLSNEEKREIINLHAEKSGITGDTIPPNIVELQKRAAVAGIGGNPPLKPEESEELRRYYDSLKK
jgi:hypothetical protein